MIKTLITFSLILLAGLLANWWLIFFSPFNIPEYIPHTPVRASGILLGTLLISSLIIFQKKLLRKDPDLTILKLTILGGLMCFVAESIFQFIRQFTLAEDHLYYFLLGTIGVSVFATIISFLVAFQLKTRKTGLLILFIILITVIANLIKLVYT